MTQREPRESPTGEPVLPQWAVRILAVFVTIAGVGAPFLEAGHWTQKASMFVVALGAGFGIVSQGVRR